MFLKRKSAKLEMNLGKNEVSTFKFIFLLQAAARKKANLGKTLKICHRKVCCLLVKNDSIRQNEKLKKTSPEGFLLVQTDCHTPDPPDWLTAKQIKPLIFSSLKDEKMCDSKLEIWSLLNSLDVTQWSQANLGGEPKEFVEKMSFDVCLVTFEFRV